MDAMGADFSAQVQARSGQDVSRCFFCQKCTAGCPTAYAMDVQPAQMLKMVQLGLKDALLRSAAIWLCVGCETCGTRCPNGIALAPVIDVLKQMTLAEDAAAPIGGPKSLALHRAFVDAIRRLGRVHEVSMLAEYKLRSADWWSDLGLGLRMFRHGKLKLIPSRVARLKEVRALLRMEEP